MCGIAGSNNTNKAFELYKSNLNRGWYSSGKMTIGGWGKDYIDIQKIKDLFGLPEPEFPEYTSPIQYSLYHSRGPTVETKDFLPENNHPFKYGSWIVAHNGIISNFQDLTKKYFPEEDFTGKTDSCIIPRMFSVKPMKEALEELKGTFGLWIWSEVYKEIYICRSGVTLFVNPNTGDFCSTEFEGSSSLEEGALYKISNYSTIEKIFKFKFNSPYYIF